MIKATIQRTPYCTEMTFPCTETQLSTWLDELRMNPEHLCPAATITQIEPAELSVLEDCEVSLDALNYLAKRMDGMSRAEQNQFFAALTCEELDIGWGMKNIIKCVDDWILIMNSKSIYACKLLFTLSERQFTGVFCFPTKFGNPTQPISSKRSLNPCLLALEIVNIGNESINEPPIKIRIDEDIEIIPSYFKDIPSGYEDLWSFNKTDPNSCNILLKHINPKQVVTTRFFLNNLPQKKIIFECPMQNLQTQEVAYNNANATNKISHLRA